MSFVQAVGSVARQYAGFSGRARRAEYWWWTLFVTIVYLLAGIADRAIGITFAESSTLAVGWITVAAWLALVVPSLAVLFRRLHDTGRTGWWWLISLVCGIGAIVVLIFCLLDGEAGANRYGPDPKGR